LWKERVVFGAAGASLNEEQELIGRAQRGEEQACQALVRQYEQIAFRVAFLITHDEHEAAEAAQEGFVRAFRALHSFKLGHPFRPWLLRIVTNLALNRVQSRQRRLKMEERYIRQQTAIPDPAVENIVADKEQQQHLLQAVSRLSSKDQALISMRYFLELPEWEVAEALDIPIGTVKSRLHRTLARLRELIRRDFPDLESMAR
jgi:RNA polymerase sigma factor (sigma-70 family)